jgi:hypothetical protein
MFSGSKVKKINPEAEIYHRKDVCTLTYVLLRMYSYVCTLTYVLLRIYSYVCTLTYVLLRTYSYVRTLTYVLLRMYSYVCTLTYLMNGYVCMELYGTALQITRKRKMILPGGKGGGRRVFC